MNRSLDTVLREAVVAASARFPPTASPALLARRRSAPRRELRRARAVGALLSLLPLLAAFELLSCTSSRYVRPVPGERQRGAASWYGQEFDGRPTSSGERFDMNGLTAAHRDLPLGTVIEVTHLASGRHVQVRINDRGPFVRGRVIDLSYGAAQALGMVAEGVAQVEIRVISLGAPDAERRLPAGFDAWAVQVGAFRDRANAEALVARLRDDHPDARLDAGSDLVRVHVGRLDSRAAAERLRRQLARRGFDAVVVAIVTPTG